MFTFFLVKNKVAKNYMPLKLKENTSFLEIIINYG